MNNLIWQIPRWLLWDIGLLMGTLFFKFALRGYGYMACAFAFAALLLAAKNLAPATVWRGLLILTCLGLMYFFTLELMIIGQARGDRNNERKYLIVLGAAVHGDEPSLALTHRLEGALAYLEKNPNSTAILSGGKGQGENISEAECMYNWLRGHGIEEGRLIMENRATTTKENLIFSFEIIEKLGHKANGNVCILSSAYHLYRAKAMSRLLGVGAVAAPGNPGYPVYMLNCFIREAFGVTHLWVFGK